MILSILGSRSRRAANEQARTELDEVMDRVTAVGLAPRSPHHRERAKCGRCRRPALAAVLLGRRPRKKDRGAKRWGATRGRQKLATRFTGFDTSPSPFQAQGIFQDSGSRK